MANTTFSDFRILSGRQALALVLVILALLAFLALSTSAHAATGATFVVNSASDFTVGGCDATHCTLREAIIASNASVGVRDTITFNIPVTPPFCEVGVCTITWNTPVEITDPVTIDGYTQPNASPNTLAVGNNASIRIVVRGGAPRDNGFDVTGGGTTIRGLNLRDFNVAIRIKSNNNVVQGNFIGTHRLGTSDAKNDWGIVVEGEGNLIGGTTPEARNLISGNDQGLAIIEAKHTTVQGNYIGTTANGNTALPNSVGVYIWDSEDVLIGGGGKSKRNVISGNTDNGIATFKHTTGVTIKSNFIGIAADGSTALGNTNNGISALSTHPDRGTFLITRNKIAHNGGRGIAVGLAGQDTLSVTMSRNQIHSNGSLGIDIEADGVTLNDALDGDTGVNKRQNFPALNRAGRGTNSTTIKGKLKSEPKKQYRVEFYLTPTCNDSTFMYGEGKKFLGFVVVKTNAKGKAKLTFTKNKALPVGQIITATATEINNGKLSNTSEFSKCRAITAS